MSAKAFLPTAPGIAREAMTVLAGALLAAFVIGRFPAVKAWLKEQWQ